LCAGLRQLTIAIVKHSPAATLIVNGSWGSTPARIAPIVRAAAQALNTPNAIPIVASARPSRKTSPMIP
jgi:hypothetical protein